MKLLRWNSGIIVVSISLIFPLLVMVYFMDSSVLKIPLYLYTTLNFTICVGSVTCFVLSVFVRLISVNEVLKLQLSRRSEEKIILVKAIDRKDDVEVIRTLADIFSDLMDTCDDINVSYGIQLMVGFGMIFFYALFASFTAYTDYVTEGRLTFISIAPLAFSCYYIFVLTIIIITCGLIDGEVNFRFLRKLRSEIKSSYLKLFCSRFF